MIQKEKQNLPTSYEPVKSANRQKINMSSPKPISTMAPTKNKILSQRDTPVTEKKPLMVHYNKQADKA